VEYFDFWLFALISSIVGLIAGMCLVSTMFLILEDKNIVYTRKEISISILSIMNDFGILAASFLGALFQWVHLKYFANEDFAMVSA
jgi:hypothetical protein